MSHQYEFDQAQNSTFSSLSSRMKFVGVVMMIMGALSCLMVLIGNYYGLVKGVMYILIGIWTQSAANSIRSIVDTEGNDINHLMNAMENLSKLYNLQRWLLILVIILLAVVFALGLLGGIHP